MPNLDISTAVNTLIVLLILGGLLSFLAGYRLIRAGSKLLFFRKRQELIARGWRMIFLALLMGGAAFGANRYAEPVIYEVFPPSPTVTLTATVTITPTVSQTPTITPTPSITPTISITPSPFIPTEVYMQFTATVVGNPNAIFSRPQFAREVNPKDFQPVSPAKEFANPIVKLYAAYSFDKMNNGAQWTAMWVRLADNKLICAETEPWAGGTGGYGYSVCQPTPDKWLPGDYEFHMFVGTTFKVTGKFSITGTPPTGTPTITLTLTPSPSLTVTPSPSPTRTNTPIPPPPTITPIPSDTRIPTLTVTPAPTQ